MLPSVLDVVADTSRRVGLLLGTVAVVVALSLVTVDPATGSILVARPTAGVLDAVAQPRLLFAVAVCAVGSVIKKVWL
jgi:hypothetical protein